MSLVLPLIANNPQRRRKLIDGLRHAVRNDAKLIVRSLPKLPPDWEEEIATKGSK